jgi:uncharacterized protein (UPF0332 family)
MASQPFDWVGFINLAEELAKRTDEASLRSAISRAYYYAYHRALSRAVRNGYSRVSDESSHRQLWQFYSAASSQSTCQRIAQMAFRLKDQRQRADYDQEFIRIADEVPDLLAEVKDFDRLLAGVPLDHPRPEPRRF